MRKRLLSAALAMSVAVPSLAAAQTKLLRFPDVHGDRVVFTYAGDLWLAAIPSSDDDTGVTARQLTTHPGLELFARFSPDAGSIAFTGQYDGDEQVYVVPAEGGVPRQLTFYPAPGPLPPRWGYDNQVYGWTPNGERVLFRSLRDSWDLADARLYTVALDGGLPTALPMPTSGAGAFSDDGRLIVYSPVSRDFRHWKRYEGGWAQDLYVFDLKKHTSRRITDHLRTDRDPMWVGEEIFFASDRDGTLNLYAFDLRSAETRQLTHGTTWDVRWPSADEEGRIVYERGGELEILDTRSGTVRRLKIRVPSEQLARRPSRLSVGRQVEDFGLAPQGRRALFAARGDIFTAPIEHGATRNLTRSSGAHDRAPAWSHDGSTIAFVSDLSGEEEIYLVEQAGRGKPERLTDLAAAGYLGRLDGLAFSPDDRRLAFHDQAGRLFVVDLKAPEVPAPGPLPLPPLVGRGGNLELVADDGAAFGLDYEWSPRGGYLAFSLAEANGLRSIYVWSADDGKVRRVTGEMWNEISPSWDPEGEYLFYLSDREFAPQLGSYELNYVVNRETCVYALALRKDVPHPFPPRSDEVTLASEEDGKKGKKDKDGPVKIDFAGLGERLARVPVAADNYTSLSAVRGGLLLLRDASRYYGRASERTAEIVGFSLADRQLLPVSAGVQGFALSPDKTKILLRVAGNYQMRDARPGGNGLQGISTADLVVERVPAEEWRQIFDETWRRFRDFFYDPDMHGYDWEALGEQYRPLLEHVAHRSDLTYVLTEMIAELEVSHAYVAGGDYEVPKRPRPGLLGARFALHQRSGRYRISEILPGHNEEKAYRSPLTEIGVDASVGDYVLEINGEELLGDDNPFRLLRHAGTNLVELTLNRRPSYQGARRVVVEPIANEDELIYLAWVERNRRLVDEESDGRVGYLHLPDMAERGIREWIKWFYGQIKKDGLVIDVRSNAGGNVSPMILERLRRELLMFGFERNVELRTTYPGVVFNGHLVCLLDEDTASDGDQFAWAFRRVGLGPLVGKRSWGGAVGTYNRAPLVDGGTVSVPESGSADERGNWVIEGQGVEPDHVVENDPAELLQGRDQQLEKAVEVVLERITADPPRLADRPPGPVKAAGERLRRKSVRN